MNTIKRKIKLIELSVVVGEGELSKLYKSKSLAEKAYNVLSDFGLEPEIKEVVKEVEFTL